MRWYYIWSMHFFTRYCANVDNANQPLSAARESFGADNFLLAAFLVFLCLLLKMFCHWCWEINSKLNKCILIRWIFNPLHILYFIIVNVAVLYKDNILLLNIKFGVMQCKVLWEGGETDVYRLLQCRLLLQVGSSSVPPTAPGRVVFSAAYYSR